MESIGESRSHYIFCYIALALIFWFVFLLCSWCFGFFLVIKIGLAVFAFATFFAVSGVLFKRLTLTHE